MNALDKLTLQNNNHKFICVGLDTDQKKIPPFLHYSKTPILDFNEAIIENTCNSVAAYKINFAFYESIGPEGFNIITRTIEHIPKDILIIADAKRGDIGNTSKMYARSIFDYFKCDAATINPLMGEDSVLPFLEYNDKLNFILALTSNQGANDFQKLKMDDGRLLFQSIISKVKSWNKNNNCGLVFGATKSSELEDNINNFDSLPVLLPGIGAQGGDLKSVAKIFFQNKKTNFLINVSRSVIYRSSNEDFGEAAANEIASMNKIIQTLSID
jgi:orotidine-5'-phosphate decarboxylase